MVTLKIHTHTSSCSKGPAPAPPLSLLVDIIHPASFLPQMLCFFVFFLSKAVFSCEIVSACWIVCAAETSQELVVSLIRLIWNHQGRISALLPLAASSIHQTLAHQPQLCGLLLQDSSWVPHCHLHHHHPAPHCTRMDQACSVNPWLHWQGIKG